MNQMNTLFVISLSLLIAMGIFGVVWLLIFLFRHNNKSKCLTKAEQCIQDGKFEDVISNQEILVNSSHNSYVASYLLARAYEGLKDYRNAINFYEKALIHLGGDDELVRINITKKLANVYYGTSKFMEAMRYYELVLQKDPYYKTGLYRMGVIYHKLNKNIKALEFINKYLSISNLSVRALYLQAKIYYELKTYQQCVKNLDSILSDTTIPNELRTEATMLLIKNKLKLREYQDVIRYSIPLMEKSGYTEKAFFYLIEGLLKTNKEIDALTYYHEYENQLSELAKREVLYYIGNSYWNKAEQFNALKIWKMLYDMDPKYKDVKLIMEEYGIILKYPRLESIVTSDTDKLADFFNPGYWGNVQIERDFVALINEHTLKIVYPLLTPIPDKIFQKMVNYTDRVHSTGLHLKDIVIISYKDFKEECRKQSSYLKFNHIHGKEFLDYFSSYFRRGENYSTPQTRVQVLA